MTPFPAGRPPWRIVLVTGLANGTGALIARMHHAAADGIGGLRMAKIFLAREPDTAPPPDTDLDATLAEWRASATGHDLPDGAAAIWSALAGPVGLAKSTAAELALIGADPARAQRSAGHALDTVRTVIDQLTGDPYLDSTCLQDRHTITIERPAGVYHQIRIRHGLSQCHIVTDIQTH